MSAVGPALPGRCIGRSDVDEARGAAVDGHERLRDRVACEIRVAEDQTGCRVQPREVHIEKRGEGVMLASPRSLDQASLIHGRPYCGTATVVVLDRVWRPCRAKGSIASVVVSAAGH